MIHHIVLVKFRVDVTSAEQQSIWNDLLALIDVVDGLQSATFGPNISPEALNKGYTHAFVMIFRDAASRDSYLEHPAHKTAGGRLVGALEGGIEGLLVVDV